MGNISIDNCVIWCGWGNACEVGIETWVTEICGVDFTNIDVIHSAGPVMAVMNGCNAFIHGITYKNINAEFCREQLPMRLQECEHQEYDAGGAPGFHILLEMSNQQYAVRTKSTGSVARTVPRPVGKTRGVHLENVSAFTDDGSIRPEIRIFCHGERENIQNVTIKNLCLNGEKQSDLSGFNLSVQNCDSPAIEE